tara:strand:+ start:284 stop:442 length:159 start_codon:yes stop_codon:yes gene_type:complete
MKFRNNWNNPNKQWDKVMMRLRISSLDIFNLEIDISRKFYLLTILNFTLKNR